MHKFRSTLVVLSVVTAFVLAVGVLPNRLHQVISGLRVAQTTASRAVTNPVQRSGSGSSPTSQNAGSPSKATPSLVVLTAAGPHVRSSLQAAAGKASVPGPGHALGHGSVLIFGKRLEFQFAAQGDPFDAQGHAAFTLAGFINSKGPVDCLDVVGSKAFLSGPLEHQVIPGFNRWILFVEDNDVADKESGTPDRIGLAITVGGTAPDCTDTFFQSVVAGSAFTFSKGKVDTDQER